MKTIKKITIKNTSSKVETLRIFGSKGSPVNFKLNKDFVPDPELLLFAKEFSDDYKILSPGDYFSNKINYKIVYSLRIHDPITNQISDTGMRVWGKHPSEVIELDKTIFDHKKFTPDFIFYSIIFCVIYSEQNFDVHKADELAVKYYLTTGRSTKNLMIGMGQLSKKWDASLLTIGRIFKMTNLLGIPIITSGYRTIEQNEKLIQAGKNTPSQHNKK